MTDKDKGDSNMTVSISATSSFDSDEEALELLVKLKDLDFDNLFTDRDTQLDSDENQGISIVLRHDEKSNLLALRTDEESNINIHLSLNQDNVEDANSILNKILSYVGAFSHNQTVIYKQFDGEFSSLDIPIKENPDVEVVGIRLSQDNRDYIIQESTNNDDAIDVFMTNSSERKFKDKITENLVQPDLDETNRFIEEEL